MNQRLHDFAGSILQSAVIHHNIHDAGELTRFLIQLLKLSDAVEKWRSDPSPYTEKRMIAAHNTVLINSKKAN